jgi:hypothetical protein
MSFINLRLASVLLVEAGNRLGERRFVRMENPNAGVGYSK